MIGGDMAATTETKSTTKRIDGDTHFQHTVDFSQLKDLLPRAQYVEAIDVIHKTSTLRRPPNRAGQAEKPDPSRDADVRLEEMDRLNFDAQVLMTQDAMPHPLNPPMNKPLWLRIELAKLYNDAAAR